MANLYIAANLVEATAWFGTAHLQFAYGNVGSLQELEVQAPDNTIFGSWDFVGVREHGGETVNPDGSITDYTSYIDPGDVVTNPQRYVRIEAPLSKGQTAENVWELLKRANIAIQESLLEMGTTINYDGNQNSNSFVRTLLDIVGIDIGNVDQVFDTDEIGSWLVSTFPGYARNVLDEAETGGFGGPHVAIGLNLVGTDGHDIINTGNGLDELDGGKGNDSINSGAGDDIVIGGLGNDFSDGGADNDTLDYSALDLNFTFALSAAADGGKDAIFYAAPDVGGWVDRFTDFETVKMSTQGTTLSIIGANTLEALNTEAITVDGNTGSNSLDLSGVEQGITADLGAGTLNVTGGETGMTIQNFENVIGTSFEDTITGNDQANMIDGGDGIDILDGGDEKDIVFGGGGGDRIAGSLWSENSFPIEDPFEIEEPSESNSQAFDPGTLSDIIDGGEDKDTLTYSDSYADVRVGIINGELAYAIGGNGATDIAFNVEVLDQIESIDFSAYQDAITFDANTLSNSETADVVFRRHVIEPHQLWWEFYWQCCWRHSDSRRGRPQLNRGGR